MRLYIKGVMMKINNRILRFADRDIILIEFDNGNKQSMYRSTGRNSAMPGTWLPFDGIAYSGRWFDKSKYVTYHNSNVPHHLERFGTLELKQLSEQLGKIDISIGEEVDFPIVNEFLSYSD